MAATLAIVIDGKIITSAHCNDTRALHHRLRLRLLARHDTERERTAIDERGTANHHDDREHVEPGTVEPCPLARGKPQLRRVLCREILWDWHATLLSRGPERIPARALTTLQVAYSAPGASMRHSTTASTGTSTTGRTMPLCSQSTRVAEARSPSVRREEPERGAGSWRWPSRRRAARPPARHRRQTPRSTRSSARRRDGTSPAGRVSAAIPPLSGGSVRCHPARLAR
jgi:hypothetical protein